MKLRLAIIKKRCPDGELYTFKQGVAVVPGMRRKNGTPYTITLKEFNELVKEIGESSC